MSKRIVWNDTLDSKRVELIQRGYTYFQVAKALNSLFQLDTPITRNAVEMRSRKTNTRLFELQENNKVEVTNTVNKQEQLFPDEAYGVNEDLTFVPEKKRRLKEIYDQFTDGTAKKILVLSDLHAPFINFKSVEKALFEHSDADILVLNGDVFDGQAMSDFDKINDFDIEVEFEQVFTLLDVVTQLFEKVVWSGGNHDASRFIRMVSRKFGAGMKNYVLKRLNPIDYIAEKYDNLIIVPNQFFQIGECVFVHPDGYSSALMSTAIGQEKVIRANAKEILPNPSFTCLVQGHTHDLGSYKVNDCLIIETGCLCYTQDYRFDKPSSRRWQQGYAVVNLNADGTVDVNNTRWYSAE